MFDNTSILSDYLLLLPLVSCLLIFSNFNINIFLIYVLPTFLIADLLSGFYHILADNYFGKVEPFASLSIDSREHHKEPAMIIKSPIKEHFKEAIFYNIPLYITVFITYFTYPNISLFIWLICIFGTLPQLTHKLSHMRSHHIHLPTYITFLQDHNIILHPNIHNTHHSHYDRNFPVLNGISRVITNNFFHFLRKTNFVWKFFNFDFSIGH